MTTRQSVRPHVGGSKGMLTWRRVVAHGEVRWNAGAGIGQTVRAVLSSTAHGSSARPHNL
jgi:hypothetical protein